MKKPYRIVLLWFFFIVGLALQTACSPSGDNHIHFSITSGTPSGKNTKNRRVDTSGWKTYRSDMFYIKYPPSWTVQDKNLLAKPMRFYIRSPLLSAQDRFSENLLVVEEPLKDAKNLDEYFQQNKKEIEDVLGNGIIYMHKVTHTELPYYRLDYKVQMNNRAIRYRQHYYVWHGKGFVVTFTGLEKDWNKYMDTIQGILDSFKIVPAMSRP